MKRYSKHEPLVFIWIVIPYIIGVNGIIFGSELFSSFRYFAYTLLLTLVYMVVAYFIFGLIAIFIKNKFPSHADLFTRIIILLPVFYFMNILLVIGVYKFYSLFSFIPFQTQSQFAWIAYIFACISSTVITFLNEAVVNWHNWKNAVTETDKLKNAFQKTKVLTLRNQISEHFLFNCLNSLSSLVYEDEAEAEKFLNEMTKLHRHMLRSDDQFLIPLKEELKLINSYLYLVKVRFGSSLQTDINIDETAAEKTIPPLSLQIIVENIINTNYLSKDNPLKITIATSGADELFVSNSNNLKDPNNLPDYEEGIENLKKKYQLLNKPEVKIVGSTSGRTITLPLI